LFTLRDVVTIALHFKFRMLRMLELVGSLCPGDPGYSPVGRLDHPAGQTSVAQCTQSGSAMQCSSCRLRWD